MKHTKAPWHIEEETDQLIGGDGYVLGMIYGASSSEVYQPDLDECRGNGQLIARAPSLLEENESLKKELDNFKAFDSVIVHQLKEELRKAIELGSQYLQETVHLKAINKQLLEASEELLNIYDSYGIELPTSLKDKFISNVAKSKL